MRRPFPDARAESVHLCDYPEPDAGGDRPARSRARWPRCATLVSLGLQVRTEDKLRVRQPLAAAEVVLAEPELAEALGEHLELVREELNVEAVHFVPKADEYVRYQIKPNFRALGPRVGKRMPALKQALAAADGAALLRQLAADGRVELDVDGERVALSPEEIAVSLEARAGFAAASGAAGVVVLRTTLTPELVEGGLFREVLNRVQALRKELDLEYTGRIRLTLDGSPQLLAAVRPRLETLCRETLALEARLGEPPAPGSEVRELEIDGERLVLGARARGGLSASVNRSRPARCRPARRRVRAAARSARRASKPRARRASRSASVRPSTGIGAPISSITGPGRRPKRTFGHTR